MSESKPGIVVCNVCRRKGNPPTGFVSPHGWAVCTDHADAADPLHPEDETPPAFQPTITRVSS